jgi:hypothetical protein
MSVAGILASSLFSNPLSQLGHKSSSPAKGLTPNGLSSDSAKVPFDLGASFAKPSTQVSGTAGDATSLSSQMTHLGQDLSGGNLPAAQADFSNLRLILSHHIPSVVSHQPLQSTGTGTSGSPGINTGQPTADPQSNALTAAWQAYSSLQQNPLNSALNGSMLANKSNLSIDI